MLSAKNIGSEEYPLKVMHHKVLLGLSRNFPVKFNSDYPVWLTNQSIPRRQLTVHWRTTMLKLHRDSSFTPPESQNCLVGNATTWSWGDILLIKTSMHSQCVTNIEVSQAFSKLVKCWSTKIWPTFSQMTNLWPTHSSWPWPWLCFD